ncbi:SAM-dependent methyltransferase [Actinomadura macrotermitis]|nr:class I SAM-dependent methyltransferase [Actinomadura macrotermitis]
MDEAELFGADYLYFYADDVDGRAAAETDLIWRLLELGPGRDVLDLACGHGRIANRLAERGCQVVGLHSSPLFLDRARRDAAERGAAVDYRQGDMRDLPWLERFDAIVSWFTAFGYFDDEGNRCVLAQAAAALRPGGRFLLDLNNLAWTLRERSPVVPVAEKGDDLVVDRPVWDPLTGRVQVVRTTVRDGRARHTRFFVRLYTFTELRALLLAAGFRRAEGYGDGGGPLTAASRRMIVVAHR